MSDFLRPEALAALARWRSPIIAAAITGLGLWWGLTSGGIVLVLGWLLVALGLVLGWTWLQRRRFGASAEGPGVVEVLEGQISYFGPSGGGFASLSELSEIRLASRDGARAWVLLSPGQPELVIPTGAAGSEALFDAFGSLPGLTGAALIAAVNPVSQPPGVLGNGSAVVLSERKPTLRRVWRRPPTAIG